MNRTKQGHVPAPVGQSLLTLTKVESMSWSPHSSEPRHQLTRPGPGVRAPPRGCQYLQRRCLQKSQSWPAFNIRKQCNSTDTLKGGWRKVQEPGLSERFPKGKWRRGKSLSTFECEIYTNGKDSSPTPNESLYCLRPTSVSLNLRVSRFIFLQMNPIYLCL